MVMELGFVEWVALVVAVLGIIKVFTLLVKRDLWINGVAKPILSNKFTPWVAGILTVVLFYYFLQYFSIVQIFALMGLFALLFDTILFSYKLPIVTWIKRFGNVRWNFLQVIFMIIWLVLSVWVIYSLFV